MLLSFLLFYLLAVWSIGQKMGNQRQLLMIACIAFTFIIGSRNPMIWDDTEVYVLSYQLSPNIFHYYGGAPQGFSEPGVYFIGTLLKVFNADYVVYLTAIAGIAMALIYRSFKTLCLLPVFGFCDYIARFMMNRDFMQIRSSICILIIMCALPLIKEKKLLLFLLVVLIAYFFHHMALIALPFYFFNKIHFKKYQIYLLLAIAFLFAIFGSDLIADWAIANSDDLQYTTYVTDEYRHSSIEEGLKNPMIYVQLFILLMFVSMEKRLKHYPYYYLLKNGYFYASLIMIVFSQFTALSMRTSAMFSTLECFIIPMMYLGMKKGYRGLFCVAYGVVLLGAFYLKFFVLYHARNPNATLLW